MSVTGRSKHWGVVGGGLLGLTLAYRLVQAGHEVVVYEAAPNVGGLAGAWQVGGITWDRHYHVTLLSDIHLRALLAELGLERDLQWRKTKTAFFADGALHPMSNIWDYMRFGLLGFTDKFRLCLTILRASRMKDWRALESVTATQWLRELSGESAVEKLWRPLLISKLGPNADRVAATFIHATITRLYAARRAGMKEEMFGYVPGGYARICEAFAEGLDRLGVRIRTSHAVRAIETRAGGGHRIRFTNGTEVACDATILTVPPPVAADLSEEFSEQERTVLKDVEYQGILCASLLLKRPLSPYYVTNLVGGALPFTGIIDMTALVDPSEFGGQGLVYLPRYVTQSDPAWDLADEKLRERFVDGLAEVYPDFREKDVRAFRVSRVRNVFPLPLLNYSRRLPPMLSSVAGLFTISSAHIVNGTLNVNETVQLANRAAAWLVATNGCPADHQLPDSEGWTRFWAESSAVPLEHRRTEMRHFVPGIEPLLQIRPDDVVLDVGSGPGLLAEFVANRVKEVHCLDVSPTDISLGRLRLSDCENVHFHLLDPRHYTQFLMFEDSKFSLVICMSVIQYYPGIDDVERLLIEIRRLVCPGARLLIADIPCGSSPIRDTGGLLRTAISRRYLGQTLRFLVRTSLSDYGRLRRELGLQHYTASRLMALLRRLDLEGEILRERLTPLPNRLHVFIRFPEKKEVSTLAGGI